MSLQKLVTTIDGMHCEECAFGIAAVAMGLGGVKSALVGFDTKIFEGEYDDDTIGERRIIKEIESIGYRVLEA